VGTFPNTGLFLSQLSSDHTSLVHRPQLVVDSVSLRVFPAPPIVHLPRFQPHKLRQKRALRRDPSVVGLYIFLPPFFFDSRISPMTLMFKSFFPALWLLPPPSYASLLAFSGAYRFRGNRGAPGQVIPPPVNVVLFFLSSGTFIRCGPDCTRHPHRSPFPL